MYDKFVRNDTVQRFTGAEALIALDGLDGLPFALDFVGRVLLADPELRAVGADPAAARPFSPRAATVTGLASAAGTAEAATGEATGACVAAGSARSEGSSASGGGGGQAGSRAANHARQQNEKAQWTSVQCRRIARSART
jgi:hypothetical protein